MINAITDIGAYFTLYKQVILSKQATWYHSFILRGGQSGDQIYLRVEVELLSLKLLTVEAVCNHLPARE